MLAFCVKNFRISLFPKCSMELQVMKSQIQWCKRGACLGVTRGQKVGFLEERIWNFDVHGDMRRGDAMMRHRLALVMYIFVF